MVYKTTVYHCDKCRRAYRTHIAADQCEINHIVEDVSKSFRSDLSSILKSR